MQGKTEKRAQHNIFHARPISSKRRLAHLEEETLRLQSISMPVSFPIGNVALQVKLI